MDKKKIIIIVGILAVAGIGYYLLNKSKKSAELKSEEVDSSSTENTESEKKSTETQSTATAKKELTTRKEKRKACGIKPINKKKREEWQKCVDAGGVASFVGDFDDFENDYIDFEGQVNNQYMFSTIQSDFGLNMDI